MEITKKRVSFMGEEKRGNQPSTTLIITEEHARSMQVTKRRVSFWEKEKVGRVSTRLMHRNHHEGARETNKDDEETKRRNKDLVGSIEEGNTPRSARHK